MLGSLLSNLGGYLGEYLGGGVIASVGRFAGRLLGNYIDNIDHVPDEKTYVEGKILNNLYIQSSAYGRPIPKIFGKVKLSGNIIWALPIEEQLIETEVSSSANYISKTYSFKYYASFAISLASGPIDKIERIFVGDKLLDLSLYNFRFYKGDEEQGVDALIAKNTGLGKTPAFRGLCYIVFESLALEEFHNKVPNFIFEIIAPVKLPSNIENKITSMVMIPGSGEFVYDTLIQSKYKYKYGIKIFEDFINCHNKKNITDAEESLNQLMEVCENINRIAVVVSWFADSLDIAECKVFPAVEYKDIETSEEWSVAGITRKNAREISKDNLGNPNYGGTVNDQSLVRYLKFLQARNIKVTLYPMIFMDIPGKPWRGRLSGNVKDIEAFFNKAEGYNNFILHYARLVKDLEIEAFIIGSEFKSLTSIKENENFPAVSELIKLASEVKSTIGGRVQLTYAADWSEYHHTAGGFYHLDDLWASPNIDFIGIDAYFPLTNTNLNPSISEIEKGWTSGEGYDYYYQGQVKEVLSPEYAWKNIEYWWSNNHYNPGGKQTSWIPKSKKIWFTEMGFPSIDKATNQPNVFFDPKCVDGGIPKYSNNNIDFTIQKKALKASLLHLEGCSFVENAFIWTWDARPYPIWPHANIWHDSYLWERGHWLNGKLGTSNLGYIILCLCQIAGIDSRNVDVSELEDYVTGVIFNKNITVYEAINILRCAYLFDIICYENIIKFCKRNPRIAVASIDSQALLKLQNNFCTTKLHMEKQLPSKIGLNYLDCSNNYKNGFAITKFNFKENNPSTILYLPIVLDSHEAEIISENILLNSHYENSMIIFKIPFKFIYLKPTDVILLTLDNKKFSLRIDSILVESIYLKITAVFLGESLDLSYNLILKKPAENIKFLAKDRLKAQVLYLPFFANSAAGVLYIALCGSAYGGENLHIMQNGTISKKLGVIPRKTFSFIVLKFENKQSHNYLVDKLSEIIIYYEGEMITKDIEGSFFSFSNLLTIGEEILSFGSYTQIDLHTYSLKNFIRGIAFTENKITRHVAGEEGYFLKNNLMECNYEKIIEEITIKSPNSSIIKLPSNIKTQTPKPIITKAVVGGQQLDLKWNACTLGFDDWKTLSKTQMLQFFITVFSDNATANFVTTECAIKINLLIYGISGNIRISIISRSQDGFDSETEMVELV